MKLRIEIISICTKNHNAGHNAHLLQCDFDAASIFHYVPSIIVDEFRQSAK